MNSVSLQPVEMVAAGLLLGRSCRSTTLFTVDELASHPAEFWNLANRTTLWKSQKRVGRNRTLHNTDVGCSNPSREV